MIEQRVKEIFSNLFELNPNEVGSLTHQESVERWDSLQHLNLIISLEEEFGVKITPEEASALVDFNKVCEIISRKVK